MSGKDKGAGILWNRPSSFGVRIYSVGPSSQKDIAQLEAVQRRAARFVKNDFDREPGTVASIYRDLKWRSLEERRQMARLALFRKILFNQNVCMRLPSYIYINPLNTRSSTRSRLSSISATCNIYKYSFMSRTITEWNSRSRGRLIRTQIC